MAARPRALGVLVLCLFHSHTALAAEPPAGSDAPLASLLAAAREQALINRERFDSMRVRQRLSALLPYVSVFVGRGLSLSRRQGEAVDVPTLYDGDRLSYSVTARWDLSRLLFSPTELQVEREAQRAAHLRSELDAEVTRLYLARRRLLLAASGQGPGGRPAQVEKLTARIHSLTGGKAHISSTPLRDPDDPDHPAAASPPSPLPEEEIEEE